jgi:hypothetical protein
MTEWFKVPVLTRRQEAEADSGAAAGPEGVKGRMPATKLPQWRATRAFGSPKSSGEMTEWFKAPVLTRRQEAEADSGAAAGPEGVKGRMPATKLP